jgi:hypothetical protein
VQQIVVGLAGVSCPLGTPPTGLQGPAFGTASPSYTADWSPRSSAHDWGALQVTSGGVRQPMPPNVATVPPVQSMLGAPQEHSEHPRVSVAVP